MSKQEQRRAERFNFNMPLTVHWTKGSEQRQAHAVTHDVSSGGVYFFLPEAIPDGTAVEIEMTLPTQITLGTPVRVRCQGHIQRCVLKPGESAGMATMIEKYEFLPDSPDTL
ncbi:MAG TPA: PilZ domain-containing protein [Candidatus Acidoferrales bacterium]|nr:PilZ domain-containing protein [Candidatus Acidoferrales bacterium]